MAARTLVIGAHTKGIGDAVIHEMDTNPDSWISLSEGNRYGEIFAPQLYEMNVQKQGSVDAYITRNGPFTHIVYSAGISALEWVKDASRQTMGKLMGVNALGMVDVASAHTRLFPEQPVRYVAIVSDAAHTPMRGSIAYCMSKAAQEMGVRVLARELAPLWTVVGVSPGVVEDTGMTNRLAEEIPEFRGWTPREAREYEGNPPTGRRVTKQEVAETVLFALTGPESLNGSIITINGGK